MACYRDSFTLPLPYQEPIKRKRRGVVQCAWFTYVVWLAVPSFVTAWSLRQLTLRKISHLLSASKLLQLALAVHEFVLVIVVQCSRTAITSKAMNCCIIKTIHYPITIAILQSNSKHISNRSAHRVVLLLPLCSAAVVISVYREQLIVTKLLSSVPWRKPWLCTCGLYDWMFVQFSIVKVQFHWFWATASFHLLYIHFDRF
jgi:hypothetical protein